ncbi:TonB-dependent receptor [Massilia cavernae]|uniref:TonB-dependent receptor n=1 Tax=Massilia cavernae TaxID=2320864 RepID=UPI001E36B560|nr:TonB-dependent receptor [Massilia cavernae]
MTAQRTAAPASKTPVAMTILAGERLRDGAIDSPSALGARLPNVHLDGAADGLRITIRGVSNADATEKGDPSAAFMQDGIYIARRQIQDTSFFDIDRVEVLRGPQGTLYGRNSTAGVVNVISNTPGRQLEGAASVGVGNYNSRKANAMVNVPVGDALALRAAVAYNKHDSYLTNGQGTGFDLGLDRDEKAARLSARLAIGKDASLLLRYDASSLRDNNDSIVPVSNFYSVGADKQPRWVDASTGSRLTNRFIPPNAPLEQGFGRMSTSGLGAEFDWNLGAVTLHYLGSHRKFDDDHKLNFHYGVAPGFALGVRQTFSGKHRQDSHELRVETGAGPLKAQAGIYHFSEDADVYYSFRDLQLLGLPPYYVFPLTASAVSKAVFGQATYSLAPSLRVTAGVRYSDDDKSRVGSTNFQQGAAFNAATDFKLLNAAAIDTHKTTWRLGAEYDVSPAAMAFATVSTGYKAGGFNDGCLAGAVENGIPCPPQVAVPAGALYYQPETLTSYEAGVKTSFWNRKATLNATAFYYDYSNLQLSGVMVVQGAPRFVTTNAGVASVTGLEVDGQLAATAADRISYSLALLDAHYKSYAPDGVHSWAGRRLDRAPRATASLGYEHNFRMDGRQLKAGIFARASAAYMISVPSQLLQYRVPGRTQTDLSLGYQPDRASWSLHAHVKNVENKVLPITIDSFGMVVPGDPRTYGVRLDYRF